MHLAFHDPQGAYSMNQHHLIKVGERYPATSMLRAVGTIGWNSNAELSNDCISGIRHTDVMKITCIRLC